jgi:hypothetical protein
MMFESRPGGVVLGPRTAAANEKKRFPVIRAVDLRDRGPNRRWLIEGLWLADAVGMVGAIPKALKTWFALDAAVSVASATPCLGRFQVAEPGKVLVFCAEDHDSDVKVRLASVCASRGLDLATLDVHMISASAINLSLRSDSAALEETVRAERPALLVLDPFVRVFSGDEDDPGQVSKVLGNLRRLERELHVAIMVIHHFKKGKAHGGQALRGTGDFHAWLDSGVYLRRCSEGVSAMTVEHRSAVGTRAVITLVREPHVHLVASDDEVDAAEAVEKVERPVRNLDDDLYNALATAGQALGHTDLQKRLHVRGADISGACLRLEKAGRIRRDGRQWVALPASVPDRSAGSGREGKATGERIAGPS